MRVHMNIFQPNNNILNANAVNGSIRKRVTVQPVGDRRKQDGASLSPQGKMLSAIENLVKQKETIRERRTELVSSTIENGGNMKTIAVQLESYDERLKDLDDQISQIMADFAQVVVEKPEEKKTATADEGKTEEQRETEKLSKLATISDDIRNADVVSSAKSRVESDIKIQETEVHLGEIDIDRLESKGLGGSVNVEKMIENAKNVLKTKKNDISNLEDEASSLDIRFGEHLNELIDKVEAGNEPDEKPVSAKQDDGDTTAQTVEQDRENPQLAELV